MIVEVLNTGTELLLGHVLNSHAQFFGRELFPLGLRVARQTCVPDGDAILSALRECASRAEIVLVTGGLGPTTDDITREAVAELLGVGMIEDEGVVAAIVARFARRGATPSPRNLRQAQRPECATVLPNPNGTAPGLYVPPQNGMPHFFLLPGPPRELHPMFRDAVVPILRGLLPEGEKPEMRSLRLVGIGESQVEAVVGEALLALPIELGYCARPGEVDVRLIGPAEAVAQGEAIVRAAFAERISTTGEAELETVVVAALREKRATLATAESCTGGGLANRLTNVPGASEVFLAGHVTYANEAKSRDLGVSAELIATHGAVSEPVARAMAEGARARHSARFALATTGIAGPGGGSAEKPVGTVFIALAEEGRETEVRREFFSTDRETFKNLVTQSALDRLRVRLNQLAT